jgi:hypothetical protein
MLYDGVSDKIFVFGGRILTRFVTVFGYLLCRVFFILDKSLTTLIKRIKSFTYLLCNIIIYLLFINSTYAV